MLTNDNNREDLQRDEEAYYEAVASQEEIYLEEVEEEVAEILEVDNNPCLPNKSADDSAHTENLNEQLQSAAEELITGDPDDPPLSREAISEMLNTA